MSPVRSTLTFITLLFPAIALAAVSSGQAEALFEQMQSALARQSYRGVIVYVGGGHIASYRLVVLQGDYARLVSLSGPAREIIRGLHAVVRLRPGVDETVVRGTGGNSSPLPFPPATQVPVTRLERYYRFALGGWDRVAGKRVRLLLLIPRDHWRYGYRVWVAQGSNLPLRSELIGGGNHVLESAIFTRIALLNEKSAYAAIGSGAMRMIKKIDAGYYPTRKICSLRDGEKEFKIDHLPPGFRIFDKVCEKPPGAASPISHVTVGDGLASISVFVTLHRSGDASLVGAAVLGSTHAVGRIDGVFSVTAMGDAPLITVSRITHGVVMAGH